MMSPQKIFPVYRRGAELGAWGRGAGRSGKYSQAAESTRDRRLRQALCPRLRWPQMFSESRPPRQFACRQLPNQMLQLLDATRSTLPIYASFICRSICSFLLTSAISCYINGIK